jgi:hypothetical protein
LLQVLKLSLRLKIEQLKFQKVSNEVEINESVISVEINRCIAAINPTECRYRVNFLISLKNNATVYFIAAGQLSRPDRDELARHKKDGKGLLSKKEKQD